VAENSTGVCVTDSRREVLKLLRQQLAFLDRGGYNCTQASKPLALFLDSPSCPNHPDVERRTPCPQCWLFLFVPEQFREELPACHFIPLSPSGESVASMDHQYSPIEIQAKLKTWLQAEIRHLEELDLAEGHVG
jgi:hypothetical protein